MGETAFGGTKQAEGKFSATGNDMFWGFS